MAQQMRATFYFVSLGAGTDPRVCFFNNPKYFQLIFFSYCVRLLVQLTNFYLENAIRIKVQCP